MSFIELKVIRTVTRPVLVEEKHPDGTSSFEEEEKFVKEVRVLYTFERDELLPSQYMTTKSKVAKKRSLVYDRVRGKTFSVAHSYEDVKKMIGSQGFRPQIGFKK